VLLRFVWPFVRGRQERGHKRKTPTFTGLQAAGAWPLTETVRGADKGGNVEEGGASDWLLSRNIPDPGEPLLLTQYGEVLHAVRALSGRRALGPTRRHHQHQGQPALHPAPRHADTRTLQQYDHVVPEAGPCRAPPQTSSKNSSSSKVCVRVLDSGVASRSGLESSQRLLEALGVGIVGAHRACEAGAAGADHGQANTAAFERLGRAAQHPALAMGEDEPPQLGVDPHGAR
jgi:hypothetical protein